MGNPLGNGQSESEFTGELPATDVVRTDQPAGAGDREPGHWTSLPDLWDIADSYPWLWETVPGTFRIPGFGDPPPDHDWGVRYPIPNDPSGETTDDRPEDDHEDEDEDEGNGGGKIPTWGAGDDPPPPEFNIIQENDGLIEVHLTPTISDEGGEVLTLFTSSPQDVKHLTYKVRLVLVDPTKSVEDNIADSTKHYPKIGYCYSAVPGDLDTITINPPKDLLRFATPPMPLGAYHILLYAAETMELLTVLPRGLHVQRRSRSRITYSLRKRFPPLYLTGKEMLHEEVPYHIGKVPNAGT